MKTLNYNRRLLAIAFLSICVLGCKEGDLIYQPQVVVDPVTNNNLDISALPSIDEPTSAGGGNNNQPEKEVFHLVKHLGGGTNTAFGNFIDLSTGEVFTNNNIVVNNHKVDLMMLNFGTPIDTYAEAAGNNLLTPDSEEIAYNDYGNDIQRGWDVRNRGQVYRLNNLQASDILWFNRTIKNGALTKGIDSFINEIIPVRNAAEYADAKAKKRLRKLDGLNMIFFKSTDRGINSVLVLTNINSTLGTEQIKLNFKSDLSGKVNIGAGAGVLKADRNDLEIFDIHFDPTKEHLIGLNFTEGIYYPTLEHAPNISDISLTFTFRPSDKTGYIFTPSSSWYVNWKAKPAVQPVLDLFALTTNYTRFSTISKAAGYTNSKIEGAKYSSSGLKQYYFSVITGTGWQSQLDNSGNDLNRTDVTYPLAFRFARTSMSGAGNILEYGAFAILERDFDQGYIKIGFKHSPIRN